MRSVLPLLLAIALPAQAADLAGTWGYDKGAEYFGQVKAVPPPPFLTLQISNSRLTLSPACTVTLKPQRFAYDAVFQSLLKEDVNQARLAPYLKKQFGVALADVKTFYEAEQQQDNCNRPLHDFILAGDTLLVPFAGSAFYRFVRRPDAPLAYGHKTASLPFNPATYVTNCLANMPMVKGVPQGTAKCAPVYTPYVATATGDALAQLIGNHNYKQGGARYADDYAPPFASKLHPVFVVLPPLKDVLLVRVDDMEPGPGEQRDVMSSVYLAIKNGKVTGQLNDGCVITADYACTDDDGKRLYQLLESGKFQQL